MKDAFAGFTIAVAGSFGAGREPGAIKKWVEGAGGDFTQSITSETTHLICAEEHLKKSNKLVQEAIKHDVYIVSFDWLEDSLASRSHKREKPYLLNKANSKSRAKAKAKPKQRAERKAKQRKTAKRLVKEFDAGCRGAKEDLNSGRSTPVPRARSMSSASEAEEQAQQKKATPPSTARAALAQLRAAKVAKDAARLAEDKAKEAAIARADLELPANSAENHHFYRDESGFVYNITLSRVNPAQNTNERYQLRIYESNANPHTYAMHVRYFDNTGKEANQLPCPIGTSYSVVFREFRRHFHRNCRVKWEERRKPRKEIEADLERERMAKVSMILARGTDAAELPENLKQKHRPFVYLQPMDGLPKGSVIQDLEGLEMEDSRMVERKGLKESQMQEQISGAQNTGTTDSTVGEDQTQVQYRGTSQNPMTPEVASCENGQTYDEFSVAETPTAQEPITASESDQTEQDQIMVEEALIHDDGMAIEDSQMPNFGVSDEDSIKSNDISAWDGGRVPGEDDEFVL
ncbi:hypothetical protein K490DRAFT_68554 [Saccharata proteae CBS 121410]|uniref:BRCT domain-containing protein n=1 Tax=Saccharata proteae CBS 121410 TaxID=1314787 RepID=A0A9P4HSR8_9PEZI|nr:hypothetical protein K490DRAFT_68554 [Saccharata proteae CBS 121410]